MTTTPKDANHPHYDWGASAAKTWRGCPGSINFARMKKADGTIPDDTSTRYSEEGTKAHGFADECLKGNIAREDIPAEFLENLIGYLDLAAELAAENGGKVFHEQQVKLFYNPEETGTLDYAVVSDDRVDILDLKYGAGVWVDADENDQLAIYAISLMKQLDDGVDFTFTNDTVIRMHIYQPRHRDFDGIPTIWECTYRDLLDFAIDIARDYETSKLADVSDLKPSKDACQFCDARRICTVRVVNMFDDLPDEANPMSDSFDPAALKSVGITDLIRLRVFERGKEIAKWFEDLNDDTLAAIERGHEVAGMKSVDGGKGNRAWGENEADAAKLLRDIPAEARYKPRRLISPAQAEKELKKLGKPFDKQSTRFQNRWKELMVQKEGKPTLALASDSKPARVPVRMQFDEEPLEGEEEKITEDDIF